jgi:ABC-type glycerol-3-phosphate transport system substrate-binding protein
MCVGSSGGASYQMSNNDTEDGTFAFEVGVAPIPQADNNNRKVISQGPSLCILKGGNTTDQQILASWLFVKFLTTNVEFQAEFSMASGYMPVLKSVTENENYAAWLNKGNGYEYLVAKCVQVGIDGRDDYFVSPAFNGSSTARSQVGALMLKCLSGEAKDDAAVDTLINDAFKEAIDECEY